MRLGTTEHQSLSRVGGVALVTLYLVAIILANLLVTWFGPGVVIGTSFFLIAGDLVVRDALHRQWEGAHLRRNMALLIAAGSLLSFLLNAQAAPIALASFLAFAAAGLVDTVVYARLRAHGWMLRSNGSNAVSGLVDSVVFLVLLALIGHLQQMPNALPWSSVPLLVLGQWAAKTAGGVAWSWALGRESSN